MLHTVNKSPFSHGALEDCLRVCGTGAAIVLIEDGVYAALANTEYAQRLNASCKNVYALRADSEARGLSGRIAAPIKLIDYAEFVELCCSHATIQSWY